MTDDGTAPPIKIKFRPTEMQIYNIIRENCAKIHRCLHDQVWIYYIVGSVNIDAVYIIIYYAYIGVLFRVCLTNAALCDSRRFSGFSVVNGRGCKVYANKTLPATRRN